MTLQSRFVTLLLHSAAALLLVGCGDSTNGTTVVEGRITSNGQPFVIDQSKLVLPRGATAPPPGSGLQIIFIPENDAELIHAVYYPESSRFEVRGPNGKGIKPGRYRVALTASYQFGVPGKEAADDFGGRFFADRTPIVREVKCGEELNIDVLNPNE
jgi:hypothetical protein